MKTDQNSNMQGTLNKRISMKKRRNAKRALLALNLVAVIFTTTVFSNPVSVLSEEVSTDTVQSIENSPGTDAQIAEQADVQQNTAEAAQAVEAPAAEAPAAENSAEAAKAEEPSGVNAPAENAMSAEMNAAEDGVVSTDDGASSASAVQSADTSSASNGSFEDAGAGNTDGTKDGIIENDAEGLNEAEGTAANEESEDAASQEQLTYEDEHVKISVSYTDGRAFTADSILTRTYLDSDEKNAVLSAVNAQISKGNSADTVSDTAENTESSGSAPVASTTATTVEYSVAGFYALMLAAKNQDGSDTTTEGDVTFSAEFKKGLNDAGYASREETTENNEAGGDGSLTTTTTRCETSWKIYTVTEKNLTDITDITDAHNTHYEMDENGTLKSASFRGALPQTVAFVQIVKKTVTETTTQKETEKATEKETQKVTEKYTEKITGKAAEKTTETETEKEDVKAEVPASAAMPAVAFDQKVTTENGTVMVHIDAEEGAFEEGTSMTVTPVTRHDILDKAIDAAGGKGAAVAMDITFTKADGTKTEPLKPIHVKMISPVLNHAEEAHVVHVADSGTIDVVARKSDGKTIESTSSEAASSDAKNAVSFESDSFSVYAIVYTVDFHWEVDGQMYEFSLPGGGFISFSDLIEVLGVAKTGENDDVYLPGEVPGIDNQDANGENNTQESAESADNTGYSGVHNPMEVPGINDQDATGENGSAALTLDGVVVSEKTREFVADVKSVVFSSPELVDVSKVESETTVGGIKESRGLDVQYSAELTEEQIAEINAQTVVAGDWALISVQPFESTESLTVTMKTGEVFEIRVTDAQLKKTVKTASGETWEITITYDDSAEIPKDAELRVEEILPEDERYEQYYQQSLEKISVGEVPDTIEDESGSEMIDETAETASEEAATTTSYAHIFDIQIWAGDQQIEPASGSTVSVSIKLLDAPENEDTNLQVVHFGKDGLEVMELAENNDETKAGGTELNFVTDEFSVYAIVGTETITVDYLTSDGETYTITVNFDKREELSNNMELIVSEIDGDSETYAQCLADAKAAMGMPEEDNVSYARFFDITIKMDGQKFEPVYPTTVAIRYKEAIEIGEDEALSVVHFAETGTEVIGDEEITISDDNKEIVYEQNSFSITGTIVAMTGWNKWPPAGNYLLAVKKDDNTYIVDKDGNLLPVTMDDAGKITIDSIDSLEDLNSGNYIWTLSKSGSVYNLKNGSNYLYPSKATGLSTSRETKNCVANYNNGGVSDQKGLSVSNTNYMFDRMFEDTSEWNTTYVPRYLGINAAGTKLTGNQTSRTTQSYLVRSIHVDGEEYTLDYLPTFDEPTDVNWDFERNVYDPDIINTLKAPDTKKILTDNSDGTYDLTLSITGQSAAASDVNKVDVVVVIDRSTSMNVGNRLRSAVDAAKAIGTTDSLFQNSGVQISVIDFDTTVGSPSQWYTSDQASQYQSYVESLSGTIPNYHYTNWQQALKAAGNRLMDGRDDAYKYVIFLTDGNPTVYGTNGDQFGGTEGPGRDNDANWGTCTNAALPYAQKLIKEGAALYVVGCGEATNAYTFTARAYYGDSYDQMSGAPAGRYLDASDDTIGSAFASVAEEIIASFTYADVAFNDGITTDYTATTLVEGNVSAASIKVIDKNGNDVTSTEGQYVSVDYTGGNAKLSFKYVKASDRTTLAVGAVTEGIGDNAGKFFDSNDDQVVPYTLKDGYKYSATFKVWPKQEAMDRIAELNNGATYTSEDEAKGIVDNGNGIYTLNTNTSAVLTYKTVTSVEGEDPVYSEEKRVDNIPCTDENGNPASIELKTTGMVLQKLWNVGLQTSQFTNMYSWTYGGDTGRSEPMLHLEYTDSSSVTHNEQFHVMPIAANAPTGSIIGTDWPVQTSTGVYQTLYTKYSIAPGIMVTTVPSGVTAKDTWTIGGTTYYVLETGHDYVITEDHISGNMEPLNEIYHPMIVGDKLYNVSVSGGTGTMTEMNPEVLTVNNYLRGGINITKKVVNAEEEEVTTDNSTFKVKIDVAIPSGTASSFSSWDGKYVIWYDTYASQADADAGRIMYEVNGKPAQGVSVDDVSQNLNYIDVTSGSGSKTLDIKAGWVIRLVNVLDGTTYTVTETENNGYEVTYSLNGGTASATPASGSVNKNAENNVQVINKQTTVPVVFKKLKTGTTDEYLDGAVFKITKWNGSSFVNVENVEGVDASSMFTIASGQNGISLPLTPGDYMLEEQTPPPGYIKTVSGVYFTVGSTISMTIEMKEIEGVETEVAKTEAAYAEPDSGDSDQRTLLIYNTPGVELPSTGGPGTLLYTLSGLALMLGAALMYGFRMRRRERRLQ